MIKSSIQIQRCVELLTDSIVFENIDFPIQRHEEAGFDFLIDQTTHLHTQTIARTSIKFSVDQTKRKIIKNRNVTGTETSIALQPHHYIQ